MGAYLPTPLTDKESTDEGNEYLACGASQMQGWRMSQEDAHICSLDYDKSTSLFAVFDGHGGSEVALYCSKKLPEFLKNTDAYKKSEYEQALRDAFIGFDATLVDEEIIKELKKLMPADKLDGETESDEDGDDYEEDLTELRQESRMPLNELLEKLKDAKNIPLAKLKQGEGSSAKPLSPFLRGRRNGPSTDSSANNGECLLSASSTSAKRQIGLNVNKTGEEEIVSSSSASAAMEKVQSANEPSSSSVTAGTSDPSPIAGSTSDANLDSGCGPSSSSSSSSAATAGSSLKLDFANSPDSSSTAIKKGEAPTEASSELNKVNAKSESHAVGGEGGSSLPLINITTGGSAKGESVSSSSAAANGVVASSTAAESSHAEKSQNKISSSANLPLLNDSDDSSTSDGSYIGEGIEAKSDTDGESDEDDEEDEEDENGDGEDDEEEEDGDTDDDMCAQDYEDDEKFLNNMFEGPGSSSGCTAVVALLAGNELYVANAGDSRCVVCRKGAAMDMSLDHKPEDAEELERIQKAGGRVTMDGRVNGGLNLSRAIGDHAYKTNKDLTADEQMISAMPDVKRVTITPEDEFMILACDGIWNSLTSEEVVEFVRSRILKGESKMSAICEELFTKCLAPNTFGDGTGCDNMTAVIIQFKPLLASQAQKKGDSEKIGAVVTTTSSTANKKRSASPTELNDETNSETHKRIKTDVPADVSSIVETAEPASA